MATQTGDDATSATARPRAGGRLRRAFERLTASDNDLDAEDLQETAEGAGATPCSLAGDRGQHCVAGRLRSVQFTPRTNLPTLEAELWDGSGTVTLVWLGRHRIKGIEPGRQLVVRGRVSMRDGRKVIYNPDYELHPSSA